MASPNAPAPADLAWDPDFEMGPEAAAIARRVWPAFLREESDVPQTGLSLELDAAEFRRRFPAWGLRSRRDGSLLGYLNAIYLRCDPDAGPLPEEGWQFAVTAGGRGDSPNCLCLVVANVDPLAQGQGIASRLLEKAKIEARQAGLRHLIAPVRPSQYAARRHLPFADYVRLRRADGLPEDPWLRAHVRAGGEIRNVCSASARVVASLARWRAWTGIRLDRPGEVTIEGGLAPLHVDPARGLGTYVEPNVWVRYRL